MAYVRSGLVQLLLVVGALCTITANATVWANRTVFDTDNFVTTANRVLDEEQVQESLATRLSNVLIEEGEVEQRLSESLPDDLQRLAPVLTAAARNVSYDIIVELLQSDTFRAGLDTSIRLVHGQLLKIIEDRGAVIVKSDQVVLDLKVVLERAADELGLDLDITQELPDDAGQIVLVRDAKTVGAVQQLLSLHNVITWAVIGAAVGAFAGAVAIARDRRVCLRTTGAVIVAMGLLSAILLLPLRPIAAGFTQNAGAAKAIFDAFFLDFRLQSLVLMSLGALVMLVAVLIGEGELARALRRAVRLAPEQQGPELATAIANNAISLRVFGFVGGALVLAVWPQPSARVYVTTFVLLGAYFFALWVTTSGSSLALAIREQVSEVSRNFRQARSPAAGESWVVRNAALLRGAGVAVALLACLAVPNFGIGALAVIVALTLVYMALVDWLASRQAR